jgi:hypothetical protein
MKWRKLGRVFAAEGQFDWMTSHAANPVAEPRGGDVFRVYFGCRDKDSRSHIGCVDIELAERVRLLDVAGEPIVVPGAPGLFDDSGTSMACLVRDGSRTLLYYLGWNLGVTVPWRNSVGLAVRDGDDGPFVKYSPAPLMDRCHVDPYTLSYPCVLRYDGRWKMWYGSNLAWGRHETDMFHVIKYAESDDGVHWRREGVVAIGLNLPKEFAVCRPWVVKEEGGYRMWFCHRGDAYRLGYAESPDGIHWTRRPDAVGLDVSPDGWDAEMVAYPFVCRHRGHCYLFYNGNRYGRTGFGVAVENP